MMRSPGYFSSAFYSPYDASRCISIGFFYLGRAIIARCTIDRLGVSCPWLTPIAAALEDSPTSASGF